MDNLDYLCHGISFCAAKLWLALTQMSHSVATCGVGRIARGCKLAEASASRRNNFHGCLHHVMIVCDRLSLVS